jgi:CHAD domain-containing protein
MADDRIREWAQSLEAADVAMFVRARARFLNRPNTKRLHALRTSARRLRSLYDDLRDVLKCPYRKRLNKLIALTGEARDAAVLRRLLTTALEARDTAQMRPLLRTLRQHENAGRKRVFRQLLRLRLK